MIRLPILIAILVLQAVCAIVFLWDLLSALFAIQATPISWQTREMMEIGAALGLFVGLGMGALVLRRAHQHTNRVEAQLRAASGAFNELLEEKFTEWRLTKAERDVALFSIKGLNLQEIAQMRQTSEGTVKAQTNAIYRKAGVSGRPQLLSVFIEELMGEGLTVGEASPPAEGSRPATERA